MSASPSPSRLWRPQAQRRVRRAFFELAGARHDWEAATAGGLRAATALVNAVLQKRYMSAMDFGVLSSMPNIRSKAEEKLQRQQAVYLRNVSDAIQELAKSSAAARLAATSLNPTSTDDLSSAVFGSLPLRAFELWANEIADMLEKELQMKELIVSSLRSLVPVDQQEPNSNGDSKSDKITPTQELNRETLQVYLTAWLVESCMDRARIKEIFTSYEDAQVV